MAFLSLYGLQAQVFEGTVYDAKTREMIPGVAVYLNRTSIYTTSDKDGNFKLVIDRNINTELVFSHLSYETLVIAHPFDFSQKSFLLKEKVSTLDEVKIVADRVWFSREQMMGVFKEQFLGESAAGKSCIILNEEDIVLNYDRTNRMLKGHSIQPILIENKYFAYHIIFDLHSFSIQYTGNTLSMDRATKVSFKGTSSYIDQSPYNIMFKNRRDEIYLRSQQYFWKNFVANTLREAKFILYNRLARIEQSRYFVTVNTPSQKSVLIIPDTNIRRSHDSVEEERIYGVIGILCNSRFRSEVVFLTSNFSVDEFGNPDAIDNLIYFGDMGKHRLGDMLPLNYTYNPPQTPRRR